MWVQHVSVQPCSCTCLALPESQERLGMGGEQLKEKLSKYCTTTEHRTSIAARNGESIDTSRYSHNEIETVSKNK